MWSENNWNGHGQTAKTHRACIIQRDLKITRRPSRASSMKPSSLSYAIAKRHREAAATDKINNSKLAWAQPPLRYVAGLNSCRPSEAIMLPMLSRKKLRRLFHVTRPITVRYLMFSLPAVWKSNVLRNVIPVLVVFLVVIRSCLNNQWLNV